MLRIANSAFYSIPQEVNNVSRALSILGTNVIKNIALSFVIAGDLKGSGTSSFGFEQFWRRSVTAAVAAEVVMEASPVHNGDIFVTALLQNIGMLVLYQFMGDPYARFLNMALLDGENDLPGLEEKNFKVDHQRIGFLLLRHWGIPLSIANPILYHHNPELAGDEIRDTARILNIAGHLSNMYAGGQAGSNVRIAQTMMTDFFDITPDDATAIFDDIAKKTADVLDIFEITSGEIKPYSQILQEANDELGKLNLSYEQLVLELKESKEKSERFANELRKANRKLEELAFKDGLTNLFNHRYFQEVLGREIDRVRRYNNPLSLILFDIDFFKKINDTYGHPAGDRVLVNLSRAISNAIRPSDIIARYGGEEFAVILPETTRSGLRVFAERLRRCAASTVTEIGEKRIRVTISCGGAHLAPEDDINQQTLIDLADRGLYLSKAEGRNRVTIADSPANLICATRLNN
jgi:diguanylate cyclase (GGDEF)-like protein